MGNTKDIKSLPKLNCTLANVLILLWQVVQTTVLRVSTNIFVGGRLQYSFGWSRKLYVWLQSVHSRSSRYICNR